MKLERASETNGHWPQLLRQWEDECSSFAEDFSDYATASIPVLDPLARGTQLKNAGVYSLHDDSRHLAACQLNAAFLPGYDGKVLRVRHITCAPTFDYKEELSMREYEDVLAHILLGVLDISEREMPAPYVKFHFRSPAERQFFDGIQRALDGHGGFGGVEMRGSWLYINKGS